MKLNKHQKEIISKILDNKVYDILSYLKCFDKYHIEKYDIAKLEAKFKSDEDGKKYKVMKTGYSRYSNGTKFSGTIMGHDYYLPTMTPRLNIPNNEWEYKEAVFYPNVKPIQYEYDGEAFAFDFVNDNIWVINQFQDLIDFFTLWNYLKNEGFIFELSKPVTSSDIGIFFETVAIEKRNRNNDEVVFVGDLEEAHESGILSKLECDYYDEVPVRDASNYIENTWKINEEKLMMSQDFIGKKIIPTSSLFVYRESGFKTEGERSQFNNLVAAYIAILISVVSVILGNILPLFNNQTDEYLRLLNETLERIEKQVEVFPESDIIEIKNSINNIEMIMSDTDGENGESVLTEIREELIKIEEVISGNTEE